MSKVASDTKKIPTTPNLVRKYLDSRQTGEPLLIFQSIQNLNDTVCEEREISYPSTDLADENNFFVWFRVLSDLHRSTVNRANKE